VLTGLALASSGSAASSVRITSAGQIGPLRMDVSTAAAVVAFAGKPDARRSGHSPDVPRLRNIALGYDCRAGTHANGWSLTAAGPTCRTVYWIVTRSARLGDFFTIDSRFALDGIRVGTDSATAERLLHQRLYDGCEANLVAGRAALGFKGGQDVKQANGSLHVVGAHAYALAVNGRAGIFDCL
jgi:hypothetical protein